MLLAELIDDEKYTLEHARWAIYKICQGLSLDKVQVIGVLGYNTNATPIAYESSLMSWPGKNKAEKIESVIDAIRKQAYIEIHIYSKNGAEEFNTSWKGFREEAK